MSFEVIGEIWDVEAIAVGRGVRDTKRLRRAYGGSRWRKMKGVAQVRLPDDTVCEAEVHWYEAHGIGKKD